MKNPFNLSNEKLKILLEAYSAWCERSEEGKYPKLENLIQGVKSLFLTNSLIYC